MSHSRLLSVLAAALALSLYPACSSTPDGLSREDRIALKLDLSRRHFALGEMERAQAQAEEGLELDPDNVDLRLTLGRILQHRANRNTIIRAEKVFRDLLDDASDDWRVPLGLGEVLERKGLLYAEAARDIRDGVRYTEAPDPEARAEELDATARASWQEAVEYFEASLAIREGEAPINGLQRVWSLLGDYEESLAWSQRLIELIQVRKRSWQDQLAVSQISAEDERRFRTRLAEDNLKEARTRLLASSALKALGRLEDAIEQLDAVIELEPDLIQAYSRRAVLHYELGNYQRSIDSIDHFIRAVADRDFDDPDVRRAYELRDNALVALERQKRS